MQVNKIRWFKIKKKSRKSFNGLKNKNSTRIFSKFRQNNTNKLKMRVDRVEVVEHI